MVYRYECPVNDWFCPYFANCGKRVHAIPMNADGKYKKSGLYDDDKYEVFQWLLSIAGDLTFRFHAWSLG